MNVSLRIIVFPHEKMNGMDMNQYVRMHDHAMGGRLAQAVGQGLRLGIPAAMDV